VILVVLFACLSMKSLRAVVQPFILLIHSLVCMLSSRVLPWFRYKFGLFQSNNDPSLSEFLGPVSQTPPWALCACLPS